MFMVVVSVRVVDLNLGVEYRYTERLSGFLNVNNCDCSALSTLESIPISEAQPVVGWGDLFLLEGISVN